MDGRRFDVWTRRLPASGSRRALLRLLAAGPLAALLGGLGPDAAAASCVPANKKCGGGKRCCHDAICKQSRCRCKPGLPACFAGKWGREGSGHGEFAYPEDVAVDGQGHV